MMSKRAWFIAVMLLFGCGSSGSGNGDEDAPVADEDTTVVKEELPIVTSQEACTSADFLAKVEADAALNGLWGELQGQGYKIFEFAGVLDQDDGVKVIWGEVAGAGGSRTGLVRHCSGDDCTSAIWTIDGNDVAWTDASKSTIEPAGVGLPILLKQLDGHTYDKPTHVVDLALDPGEEMPEIDVSKRRFYAVSSFGNLWADASLSLAGIGQMAQNSGSFDEVTRKEYVGSAAIDDILLHSHPHDVLIWLGQAVREEAKTNEIYKPIGMTVNAGVFGDALYDRSRMDELLSRNPLNGPGLMLLAGCETMGDGNGGGEVAKSIPVTLDNKVRTLVGFRKCGDSRDVLQATTLFLEGYLGGETLGAALAVANAYLDGQGSKLTMATLPEADLETAFVQDLSSYWERYADDGPPGESFLNANINVVNKCVDKDGKSYQENESFASAWSKEIKWQGPFFSGSRQNPANQVDFEVSGALKDIRVGAHFFFVVTGDLSPKVQGLTMYADAVIKEIVLDKEKLDEFTLEFKGVGETAEYINEAGDTCQMQDPLLMTTTGEPSIFKIPVTWKNKDE